MSRNANKIEIGCGFNGKASKFSTHNTFDIGYEVWNEIRHETKFSHSVIFASMTFLSFFSLCERKFTMDVFYSCFQANQVTSTAFFFIICFNISPIARNVTLTLYNG